MSYEEISFEKYKEDYMQQLDSIFTHIPKNDIYTMQSSDEWITIRYFSDCRYRKFMREAIAEFSLENYKKFAAGYYTLMELNEDRNKDE